MRRLLLVSLLCILVQGTLFGQLTNSEKFSYALADVYYSSDAVFMGRRDSIEAPYILPSLGYYDKSGFFADASFSYLVKSDENRIDLFLLSAGYMYTSDLFSATLSGTKYFFNDESYNVQSEIEADLSLLLSYDFKLAEISLGLSSYFGNTLPDYVASVLLDHDFYALDEKLLIAPGIGLSAGTQHFYQAYYRTSRLGNRKGKNPNQQGPGSGPGNMNLMQISATEVSLQEASDFNILNLELRLPLQFYHKSFIFSFTPVMAFPQSAATITTPDGIIKEDLENTFYWSAGISYWLKTSD